MEEADVDNRPASFWFFAVGTAALFIAGAAMVVYPFTVSEHFSAKALKQGQRVVINFKDGTLEGSLYKDPEVKIAVPPPPTPVAPTPPEPVKPTEPVKPDVQNPPIQLPSLTTGTPALPPVAGDVPSLAIVKDVPQIQRGTESLAFAPYTPLTEKVGDISLPRIAPETKETPWKYYGKPVPASKLPKVAVVITGLGQSRSLTDASLKLAPLFTLSFSPYAKDTPLWVINARNKGFESWIDLPVEPADFPASDPGAKALLGDKMAEDNIKNLYWTLSRFHGYCGVVVPASEKLTTNESLAAMVSKELSDRGLQLTYVQNALNQDFAKQAEAAHRLVIPATVALDEKLSQADILLRLGALVTEAKKNGVAVGHIRAFPVSLEALKVWTTTLKASGVELVPLTAIAEKVQ